MESKIKIVEDNITLIKELEESNVPLMEVARILKIKYDTLKKHLTALGIDYRKNPNRKGILHKESRKSLEYVLNSNMSNSAKRIRLIEEGVKEDKCECCGLSEWMGKHIPLELHHIDFNHYNNNLNNLAILCANCHMQAHNYCNISQK
jgi:hypothetical protein